MSESKSLPSRFSALLQCKCPRCRKGNVFVGKALDKNYRQTYTNCPVCGLRYEKEVGFFWGAMYVGYAINVALSVTLGIATYIVFGNPEAWVYITVIVAAILLTSRWNFRYARIMLLYTFNSGGDDDETGRQREINSKTNPHLN